MKVAVTMRRVVIRSAAVREEGDRCPSHGSIPRLPCCVAPEVRLPIRELRHRSDVRERSLSGTGVESQRVPQRGTAHGFALNRPGGSRRTTSRELAPAAVILRNYHPMWHLRHNVHIWLSRVRRRKRRGELGGIEEATHHEAGSRLHK